MFKLNPIKFSLLICASAFSISGFAGSDMQQMSDQELADTTGQALMSLSYLAPTDSANPMRNISGSNNTGFYKLGLEAELSLNANIKNLQLGCGGVNGAGACDIDIKNLSLSGLPDSYDSSGNPVFNNGRASTSASLTNPFIEFAISNPDKASTRQVTGIRFGAQQISALLTAGLDNLAQASTTDGIQSLSGFMQIASTTGSASTKAGTFGLSQDQILGGYATALGSTVKFTSDPNNSSSTGITIPSVSTTFNIPQTTVNGVRQRSVTINNIPASVGTIPIAADGSTTYPASQFANDALMVNLGCDDTTGYIGCGILTALASKAKFLMAQGSNIQNVNLSVNFIQALSMVHNIPLTGTGGYLSLQSSPLLWPGATIASGDSSLTSLSAMSANTDVAQKGWWMSFAQPVQLGTLNVQNQVDISAVYPQVAKLVTQFLSQQENYPALDAGQAIGAVFGIPITQKLNVDLGSYTTANPATLTLMNQQLANQKVVTNCYGGLKFC